MYLRTCGGVKSAKKLWFTNPKSTKYKSGKPQKIGPQIENPQIKFANLPVCYL